MEISGTIIIPLPDSVIYRFQSGDAFKLPIRQPQLTTNELKHTILVPANIFIDAPAYQLSGHSIDNA